MKRYFTIILVVCNTKAFFTEDNLIFQKCVSKTVRKVFSENETIIHIYNKNETDFPINENNPKVIFNANSQIRTSSYYKNNHNYILHAETYNDLMIVLQALALSELWHNCLTRDGKFLLITNEKNLVKKITFFWSMGSINLVVLVYDSKEIMTVFTSDPQAVNNNCGLNLKEYLTMANCFSQTPIVLPKIMRKYTNCNVTHVNPFLEISNKVRVFESIRFLLDLLAKSVNVTLRVVRKGASSHQFDLFSILATYLRFPKHVYTRTFFADKMKWVVPFPRRIPMMKVLQIVFKEIVWIYIFVAFVGASVVWWLITKVLQRSSSMTLAFLEMFSVTLFGSVNSLKLSWSKRFLYLAYVLYSIHIQAAFTSKLIEILTIPQYEPRIKTLTELSNANVVIYVRKNIYELLFVYEEPNGTLFSNIKNKLVVLPTELFATKVTDHNTFENSAALLTSNEVEILSKHLQMDFYTIEDSRLISNVYQIFEGAGGSYILKTFDHIIKLLTESGILSYFLKNVEYEILDQSVKKGEEKPPLSLQHLYFVFVFWGAAIAIVFTIDAVLSNHNSNRNECVRRIMKKVFDKNETIIQVPYIPTIESNPRILFDFSTEIVIPRSYQNRIQNYVIYGNTYKDVYEVFHAIRFSKLWHNKFTREGKFLLITADEDLEEKFKFFWKLGIINLIFLTYDSFDVFNVLTSDPQAPENNCGETLRTFTKYDCFAESFISLPKIWRKYTNCNVTHVTQFVATTGKAKQLESTRFVLDMLVEHFDVKITSVNPITTTHYFNIFSIYTANLKLQQSYVFTPAFFLDKMTWVVPFPQRIPTMRVLLIIFKKLVWIGILTAFVATSLTWWAISKGNSSLSQAFLKVFSITLFGSVDKYGFSWSIRCLFVSYAIYSHHIQTAFTSKLIQILTIPQYEPKIKTLIELSESRFDILIKQNIYEYFFNHEELNGTLYNTIKSKFKILPENVFSTLLIDANTYTKFAALLTKNELEIVTRFHGHDFCTIEDTTLIANINRVFMGLEGAYVLKTIEKLISVLIESGLLGYFIENVEIGYEKANEKNGGKPALSLEHLYFVFVFGSVGLVLSGVVLFFEVVNVYLLKKVTIRS
ncbi:hypothetical protein FQR65_LT12234 [Abscondita terminalis]|nr:hypothetical protein FQR65_LT12234 [Abscondita terminalis]